MTTISTLPTAPQRTDDGTTFASRADAFVAALATFVTETNAVAGEVNAAKTAAELAETNAQTAETNAELAEAAAEAAAQVLNFQGAYAGGTTYTIGQSVISSGKFYVSLVNGNVGNTPASSPSQWQWINTLPSFTGNSLKHLRLNTGETDLEFVNGAGWELISKSTPSGAAAVDFTLSGYDAYKLLIVGLSPSTDTQLNMRTSTDGGSSFTSAAASYDYEFSTPTGNTSVASATEIAITNAISGTASNGGACGEITISNPGGATNKLVTWQIGYVNSGPAVYWAQGSGRRLATTAVNAVRLLPGSGNLTGTVYLFGVKNT